MIAHLRRNRCRSPGILLVFAVKVGGVAVVILHHSSSLQSFKCLCNIIIIMNNFVNGIITNDVIM